MADFELAATAATAEQKPTYAFLLGLVFRDPPVPARSGTRRATFGRTLMSLVTILRQHRVSCSASTRQKLYFPGTRDSEPIVSETVAARLLPDNALRPSAAHPFSRPSGSGYCSYIAHWHQALDLPKGPLFGGHMRKPRPASYNPAQALNLIASDRTGIPLVCPSCASAQFEREPALMPPPPRSHVTLRCETCGRVARYIAGAA